MKEPMLKVTKDFTADVLEVVKRFKRDAVVVGIPAEEATRKDDNEINNATLLAINHFGSEANGIPPRPVLTIGLEKAQDEITDQFKNIAKLALSKGFAGLEQGYERVGMIAANSVKRVINDQTDIDPPADSTLRSRKYLTSTGFKGIKALLVTGQLRNSITYIVRRRGTG